MKNFKKKIFQNYNFSLSNYDKISKSLYWKKSTLRKKKLFSIKNLENFRSNNLSKNIDDDYLTFEEKSKNLKIAYKEFKKNYFNFLENSNIGNPQNKINFKGKNVVSTDIFLTYYFLQLKEKINLNNLKVICEIGQGYGLFISKFLKKKDPKTNPKIILIDLPESNFITAFFLKKKYPKKVIFLDVDLKKNGLTRDILLKGDIFIISPWTKIKDIKIDLFINMRSMMEMNNSSISNYLFLIKRKISKNGFFYCVNRYYKDLVGYPVELHRYPFGENWNPLISKQSKLQENTHILLLKKSIKINKKFKSELKKIKKKYIQLKKKDKYLIRRLLPIQIYRIYKLIKFFLIKR